LKNKDGPLAQLAEQLTLNQLGICKSLFLKSLKSVFLKRLRLGYVMNVKLGVVVPESDIDWSDSEWHPYRWNVTLFNKPAAESIFPDVAKVLFWGLLFVFFLIDIVEMRQDKDKAYQFLFLSLVVGGLSATISAMQYQSTTWLAGNIN
jgi:hypothetical protein